MRNNKAFYILDTYQDESFLLYNMVRALFHYPSIENDYEDENIEGKFFASAFVFIIEDFLSNVIDYYKYDDFGLFIEEMNFRADKEYIIEHYKDIKADNFSDLVFEIIKSYKKRIAKDIKDLFKDKTPNFFSGIFYFSDGGEFLPEISLDSIRFFDEFGI